MTTVTEANAGGGGRLEAAFARAEQDGLRLVVRVRTAALIVVAIWILVSNPWFLSAYYLPLVGLFALTGLGLYGLNNTRFYAPWMPYAAVLLDAGLIAFTLLVPPLTDLDPWPPQMAFRFGNFAYLFLLLSALSLTYSPRLLIWGGLALAAAWGAGTIYTMNLPESLPQLGTDEFIALSTPEQLGYFLQPNFVPLTPRLTEIIVLLLVTGTLAAGVWRARRLVENQALAERERTNLARYFAPNIVDELARSDEPLGAVRQQDVAVLFVDIVGFTRLAEDMSADEVIVLLRDFHGRMERCVFDHGGTLDKYLGDGLMATFGTPQAGPHDAANAIACGKAMLAEIAEWNAEREARGRTTVRIGLGIHYGPVVLGDIGSARRLEFAVVGDTVNVASRLEALTRELAVDMIVSEDAATSAAGSDVAADLDAADPQPLRGRAAPLAIRTWRTI